MLTALIIQGIMILLFLILGVIFALGKGQKLIAGYNTMSEKERAGYDEKKLLHIMRNGMFAFAACMAVSFVGMLLDRKQIVMTGYALMAVIAIILIIRANTAAKK